MCASGPVSRLWAERNFKLPPLNPGRPARGYCLYRWLDKWAGWQSVLGDPSSRLVVSGRRPPLLTRTNACGGDRSIRRTSIKARSHLACMQEDPLECYLQPTYCPPGISSLRLSNAVEAGPK